MRTVLSFYPLTTTFKALIESRCGPVDRFVVAGEKKHLKLLSLVSFAFSIRSDSVVVATENDNQRPLELPLLLIAFLTRARRLSKIRPDGEVLNVSRLHAMAIGGTLLRAQVSGRLALHASARLARHGPMHDRPRQARQGQSVLYIDANLTFGVAAGGSLGHTKGVIDALTRRDFDVDYLSVKPIPTDAARTHWLAVSPAELVAFPVELNYYIYQRRFDENAAARIREGGVGFVYQRMSLHNISGVQLRNRFNLPLVLEYNGSEAWAAANWNTRLGLHDAAVACEKHSLLSADLVVTVSRPLMEEVAALGVPRERIVLYPNCIDPAMFSQSHVPEAERTRLRAKLGLAQDARVATFIGTFGTWHGVDFLARAIRRMVDKDRAYLDRTKLHFLLVGDGLKMNEVQAEIGDAPYSQYVTFTGIVPQRDAPAYLAISDIFLSPHLPNPDNSAFFGSPTKLFEYMAMDRPIVAAELEQIGRVLRGEFFSSDGVPFEEPLAALFTPGDEDGMLAALRGIVDDLDLAHSMAARARQEVLTHYTWDHHVAAILERMEQLGLVGLSAADATPAPANTRQAGPALAAAG